MTYIDLVPPFSTLFQGVLFSTCSQFVLELFSEFQSQKCSWPGFSHRIFATDASNPLCCAARFHAGQPTPLAALTEAEMLSPYGLTVTYPGAILPH
jgi:hypothetical protein